MGLPQPIRRCTAEEYLRFEYDAEERHQFYEGEIFAMAGGSPQHSLVIANVIGALGGRLVGKPCRVYDSNLRVRIPRTTLYTYPDASVICGELQFDSLDTRKHTVTNPTLLVEVLSPTTEGWDRGGKFQNYRRIDSLKEYVLVNSDTPLVETFIRQATGSWMLGAFEGLDAVAQLPSLGIELSLREIYAGITFPPPGDAGIEARPA